MRLPRITAPIALCLMTLLATAVSSGSVPDSTGTGSSQPAPATGGTLHLMGKVQATNDDWFRTGVRVQKGDLIVVIAQGSVTLGKISGKSGPNGDSSGSGLLEGKIASGAPFAIGARYAFVGTELGLLKIRVRDSRRDDNEGAFDVQVFVIPAADIPEARTMSGEDD